MRIIAAIGIIAFAASMSVLPVKAQYQAPQNWVPVVPGAASNADRQLDCRNPQDTPLCREIQRGQGTGNVPNTYRAPVAQPAPTANQANGSTTAPVKHPTPQIGQEWQKSAPAFCRSSSYLTPGQQAICAEAAFRYLSKDWQTVTAANGQAYEIAVDTINRNFPANVDPAAKLRAASVMVYVREGSIFNTENVVRFYFDCHEHYQTFRRNWSEIAYYPPSSVAAKIASVVCVEAHKDQYATSPPPSDTKLAVPLTTPRQSQNEEQIVSSAFTEARVCIRNNIINAYQSGVYGFDQALAFFKRVCSGPYLAYLAALRPVSTNEDTLDTFFKVRSGPGFLHRTLSGISA
jgi:hypothetical protein